jgi:hypothetical protein
MATVEKSHEITSAGMDVENRLSCALTMGTNNGAGTRQSSVVKNSTAVPKKANRITV